MEPSIYYQLAEIEDTHWWFVYRRKLMALLIERLGGVSGQAALDVGCGTGGNMGFLKNYCSTVTGIDLSVDALALARGKYPADDFVEGDINKLRDLFAPASFDLVSDFTVLYHSWIKSDLQSMRDMLSEAGFRDVQGTYFNLPAFPIVLLLALVDRLGLSATENDKGVSELTLPPAWLNDVAGGVLGVELAAIRAFGRVPFGVSVACVARKPLA
jgi:SAM-dependent methyltransferase